MAGKRILDAAALLAVSRGVFSKHIALRAHQLDTYSKTSSLAKAVKSQTGTSLTAQAASVLARRYNGSTSGQSEGAQASTTRPGELDLDLKDSNLGHGQVKERSGLEQDHFYERSEANSTANPAPSDTLDVAQEKAKRSPLPDGTIPPPDSNFHAPKDISDSFSLPQRAAPSKQPLVENGQKLNEGLQPEASERSSISNPTKSSSQLSADEARKTQRRAETQIPSKPAEAPPAKLQASEPVKNDRYELNVDQDKDLYYTQSANTSPVLSSLPRVKLPKNTEDSQDGDEHVRDEEINQDVFYSHKPKTSSNSIPNAQAIPTQESVSEDMYSEIFQSPRVAKLLRNKPGGQNLKTPAANNISTEETKSRGAEDRETFNTPPASKMPRGTSQMPSEPDPVEPSDSSIDADIRKLAADVAGDSKKVSTKEVWSNACLKINGN